jgi:predicted RNA-binding protein with PUA-like domain
MRKGDLAIVYHTGREKAAVGVARVASDPYPDPARKDSRFVVVDLAPLRRWTKPVPLAEIKMRRALSTWDLVRNGRLSVMPATEAQWAETLRLAGEAAE